MVFLSSWDSKERTVRVHLLWSITVMLSIGSWVYNYRSTLNKVKMVHLIVLRILSKVFSLYLHVFVQYLNVIAVQSWFVLLRWSKATFDKYPRNRHIFRQSCRLKKTSLYWSSWILNKFSLLNSARTNWVDFTGSEENDLVHQPVYHYFNLK